MPASVRRAAETIRDMFEEHLWPYEYNEEKRRFSARFDLEIAELKEVEIHIHARPSSIDPAKCRSIVAYGRIHLKADLDRIAQVCEYLTRANFGLAIGNFELDYSTGVIRYKVAMNCRSGLPGISALEDLVAIPVAMFNRYGKGLLAVNNGTMTAEDAARQADAK